MHHVNSTLGVMKMPIVYLFTLNHLAIFYLLICLHLSIYLRYYIYYPITIEITSIYYVILQKTVISTYEKNCLPNRRRYRRYRRIVASSLRDSGR